MSTERYRVGVIPSKIVTWKNTSRGRGSGHWYSNYGSEADTVSALAKQIERDLKKWQIYEAKHGSGLSQADRAVSPEKHREIIRAALLRIANAA